MSDWNVVATLRGSEFRKATRLLGEFGRVERTPYYNVVVAEVADPRKLLESLDERLGHARDASAPIASVIPVTRTFRFQGEADLEAKANEVMRGLAPSLAGKSFHVRVHHRGARGVSGRDLEQKLAGVVLDALSEAGASGRIKFADPDAIVDVELVGARAGVSMWTRDELRQFPILHLD